MYSIPAPCNQRITNKDRIPLRTKSVAMQQQQQQKEEGGEAKGLIKKRGSLIVGSNRPRKKEGGKRGEHQKENESNRINEGKRLRQRQRVCVAFGSIQPSLRGQRRRTTLRVF